MRTSILVGSQLFAITAATKASPIKLAQIVPVTPIEKFAAKPLFSPDLNTGGLEDINI